RRRQGARGLPGNERRKDALFRRRSRNRSAGRVDWHMMDTATAARAVNGRMLGGNVRFARVATDTRTLAAGDLFVAIKGERFDGHDFVGAAFERGAVAALVGESRADTLAGN